LNWFTPWIAVLVMVIHGARHPADGRMNETLNDADRVDGAGVVDVKLERQTAEEGVDRDTLVDRISQFEWREQGRSRCGQQSPS
jgi:hypothetical protein